MKKSPILSLLITLLLTSPLAGEQIRSVILLIPDGMSLPVLTISRWVKGEPLAMDRIVTGLVRTHWAGGPITDSAPAASAMATGIKTWDKYISVTPPTVLIPGLEPPRPGRSETPLPTILEAARLSGRSTGIVSTSEIQHATPAAFSSHAINRSHYDDIAEQQVHNRLTVAFGGGRKFLKKEHRKDGEDLFPALTDRGIRIVTNLPDFREATETGPLWALFAPAAMSMDAVRDPEREPSLEEMTRKALAILSRNTNGFFLMVEGSQVDWAAHANDPAGIITEFLAFDRAVAAALAFAKEDGATAVIAASDHGNSGISLGSRDVGNYPSESLDRFVVPLRNARVPAGALSRMILPDRSNLQEVLRGHWSLTNLSAEETALLISAEDRNLQGALSSLLSRRAGIGFTTWGHTGEDVILGFYSPSGTGLGGVVDNTDIALYTDRILNLGLERLRGTLFTGADEAFPEAVLTTDETDPENPVLVVSHDGTISRYPLNRDTVIAGDGRTQRLMTPTVRIRDRWFVSPQEDSENSAR